MTLDPRTPVLVGVGVASEAAEAAELMAIATERAAADAGATSLLRSIDRVAVPRGTWGYTDPARLVAGRVGASGAHTVLVDLGIPQQTLVNDALSAIVAGRCEVALVVGGEAKRRAQLAERSGATATETSQGDAVPDELQHPAGDIVDATEVAAGIWMPVVQYALIENALRAAEHRSIADQRGEIADLWARFNEVARRNPAAAFPEPRTAGELATPGPGNRPLAFPYNKWHASQWTVDQAAALLLCSAESAERHGVARDRWVFPLAGVDSSLSVPLSRRRHLHRWPAMGVLGEAVARHAGRPLAEMEHVELYSCFPAAVRVQQRELSLPLGGTPTLTGGMAFAGGPFNNFVYQATVAMAERLRGEPGALGLVSTVSGLLTKPGLALWSAEPPAAPALVADLASEAAAVTETAPVVQGYEGPATVVSSTVTYRDEEPERLVLVADTPEGSRCIAVSTDGRFVAEGMSEELAGAAVHVKGGVAER